MDTTSKSKINLADLTPLERKRRIKVKEAAALNSMHVTTFKRNYRHLIERVGKRMDVVTIEDALRYRPK